MLWLVFAVVALQFHNCVSRPQFDFGEYDYADQFPNPNKFTEVAPFATNKATQRTTPMRPTQPITTRPSPPVTVQPLPLTTRPSPPETVRPSPPVTVRPSPPKKTRPSPPVAMRPSPPITVRPPGAGRPVDATTADIPQTFSQCLRGCEVTSHYHPICGTDNRTYNNMFTLKCAQFCGRDVEFSRHGPCCIPWESWK